jgi:hypothetical protein
MKNFKLKSLFGIGMLLILPFFYFYSCSNEKEVAPQEESPKYADDIPEVLNGVHLGSYKIPDGTRVKVIDASFVEFYYPEGVKWIGENSNGDLITMASGSYTCSCEGGGCDVFYFKGSFGCSECTSTCTGKKNKELEENLINAGFVDLKQGISIIAEKPDPKNYYRGPSLAVLAKVEGVMEEMQDFNRTIHGTANPDFSRLNAENSTYVYVNLFGTLAAYKVPNEVVENQRIAYRIQGADCNCDSGDSGCSEDGGFGYEKCTAGDCRDCTMKITE